MLHVAYWKWVESWYPLLTVFAAAQVVGFLATVVLLVVHRIRKK